MTQKALSPSITKGEIIESLLVISEASRALAMEVLLSKDEQKVNKEVKGNEQNERARYHTTRIRK